MPLKFRKVLIADERYESAGVFDVDGDGVLDIASGAWWYEGPDFAAAHKIGDVLVAGEYFDDFSTIPMDVNGDSHTDFITGGWFGQALQWRENPGDREAEWPLHCIVECGSIETTRAWDALITCLNSTQKQHKRRRVNLPRPAVADRVRRGKWVCLCGLDVSISPKSLTFFLKKPNISQYFVYKKPVKTLPMGCSNRQELMVS